MLLTLRGTVHTAEGFSMEYAIRATLYEEEGSFQSLKPDK